ncbi:hypothetical protein I79_003221 [Cricetulus griseus]|uniref:Uncharacterized protein n=1 Tax=Cricetulus griseus TaxID=10029 RepID=G3GZF6_CRIGR|nr:hypothetical protein I79_003221 [Cricetulus griseus]
MLSTLFYVVVSLAWNMLIWLRRLSSEPWGYTCFHISRAGFLHRFWGSNFGPCACLASTFPFSHSFPQL